MNNEQGFQRNLFSGLSRPKVPLPVEQEGTGGASTNPNLKPHKSSIPMFLYCSFDVDVDEKVFIGQSLHTL